MGLHKTENRAAKVVYDISQIPVKYLEDPSAFAVLATWWEGCQGGDTGCCWREKFCREGTFEGF